MGHGPAFWARRGATAGKPRAIAAATALALAATCLAATGATASTAFPNVQHNPRGKFLGVVPSAGSKEARRGSALGTLPLLYHHGPVQHSSRVYSIFWGPPGFSFTAGYANVVNTYFNDVAADSFKTTNVYASDTQYYDVVNAQKRPISYNVTNAGAINDTNPYPSSGCPNYKLYGNTFSRACLTDQQLMTEINRVVASRGLPRGLGVEYFLFTPRGLGSCFDSRLADGCSERGYCAYHSWIGGGSTPTLYSSMPYSKTPGCDPGATPHGTEAEAVLNVTSHEHNETITDPTGGGWYDSSGNENGDKCSWDFGATTYNGGLGYYNQVINGHQYLLQQEWSNRTNRCLQRGT
jgi:hypothetical protein